MFFNPAYYMIETFRVAILAHRAVDWRIVAIFAACALAVLLLGATLMRRFKSVVIDYE
jgi:ABC-type polysaccharide/polyol phosphate export permease